MSLSPDQLAQRLAGMTATDIGAVVGANPFRSPMDVFLEKIGERPPFEETTRSRWGHKLERPIRADYEEIHQVRVEVPGTLFHPAHPWQMATPDGLVYQLNEIEPERGMEIKVHGRDALYFGNLHYGDPGSDDVPPHELLQCAWNMQVTGLPRWDLVAFLDGAPVEYIIDRDDELNAILVEKAERFFVDHVQTGTPPEPDGSDAWDAFLKRKWKTNTLDLIQLADAPEIEALLGPLQDARAELARLEDVRDAIQQKIKLAIGDKSGVTWKDAGRKKPSTISWKRSKSRRVVDYMAVLGDMRQSAALVAAGKAESFERALRALGSHGAGAPVGTSSQAFITAGEIVELLTLCRTTLLDINRSSTEPARTKIVDGNRPFCVPRHWKASKSDRKTDDDNQEGN